MEGGEGAGGNSRAGGGAGGLGDDQAAVLGQQVRIHQVHRRRGDLLQDTLHTPRTLNPKPRPPAGGWGSSSAAAALTAATACCGSPSLFTQRVEILSARRPLRVPVENSCHSSTCRAAGPREVTPRHTGSAAWVGRACTEHAPPRRDCGSDSPWESIPSQVRSDSGPPAETRLCHAGRLAGLRPTSAGMTGGSEARCIIHAVYIRVRFLFHLELAGGAHLDDHGPQQARVQVVAAGGVVGDAHLPGDGEAPSARPRLPQGGIDPGRMLAQAPVPPALETE